MKENNGKGTLVLRMIALCFASSIVFEIPYLSWTFYDAMQESLQLTNAQMGSLMTVYGISALICRFPGGWLADVVSERILLTISLSATGILGLFVMLHPPYVLCLVLWACMGITAVLPMWAAIIKATRRLGDSNAQNRLFGVLESGRSAIPMLYCLGVVAIFDVVIAKSGSEVIGLNVGIISFCALMFVSAVLIWIAYKPREGESKTLKGGTTAVGWTDVKKVIKLPGVWLIAGIIFSSYLVYISLSYITPYTTDIYGASTSTAAVLAVIRTYGIGIFGALIAGFIADKAGSTTKVIAVSFVLIAAGLMSFFIVPVGNRYLWVAIIIMMTVAFIIFIPRGIYFAIIDEIGIPVKYTGAAVGVASFIGFSPDMFAYSIIGSWLDNNPGIEGYHKAFMFMAAISLLGFIFSIIAYKYIKKHKQKTFENEQ